MIDITHKWTSLRIAVAQSILKVGAEATIEAVKKREVPKGDVMEMAKAAALFAVKKTADMIPDCHPMPVEGTSVHFSIEGLDILIRVEVRTVYKTGVEVEAMHGAAIAALTMYDMLKPLDKELEIVSVKLIEKKGGKSDLPGSSGRRITAAVIVCSDSAAAGTREDRSGQAIMKRLEKLDIETTAYHCIPDDAEAIREQVSRQAAAGTNIVILSGGTGLSSRDHTPDIVRGLLDKEIPGIMEAARNYGMSRMPYAMLSRSIAGIRERTLVLCLPGSVRAVEEYMNALFPFVLHVFPVMNDEGHT